MNYSIEIYLDGGDDPEFTENARTPYPVPAVGDFVHPAWKIAQKSHGYYPGDRYRVVRVEHVVWAEHHGLMIFCEDSPGPQNPRYRGANRVDA